MSMELSSSAFQAGQPIPVTYTADGRDTSPPLRWSGLPQATSELAMIVDDPDAPRPEPFVHWVIYKIAADVPGLVENIARNEAKLTSPPGAFQGTNSMNKVGYAGPAPPRGHGIHHYHFHLYALDEPLEVKPKLDKKALLAAMAGHILGQAELIGTYQRR